MGGRSGKQGHKGGGRESHLPIWSGILVARVEASALSFFLSRQLRVGVPCLSLATATPGEGEAVPVCPCLSCLPDHSVDLDANHPFDPNRIETQLAAFDYLSTEQNRQAELLERFDTDQDGRRNITT